MNPVIQKRRNTIINFLYIALILGLIYVFCKYAFGAIAPFLIPFVLSIFLQRPIRWLDKKTKHKLHGFWSVLLVLLCIVIILGPVVTVLALIGKEVSNFITYISGQLDDIPKFLATAQKELLDFLKFLPEGMYTSASDSINEFFTKTISNFDLSSLDISLSSIASGLSSGITGVYSVVKNIPSFLIALIIGIIAWIFFTMDYDKIVKFIILQLPDRHKNIFAEIKQIFSDTIFKMIKAYALIMFITFLELFLGLAIMRFTGIMDNNYILIIAIATAVFDILPVAGSGGVLMPWALASVIMGNSAQAIGLMILYVVISVIRQYIEPKIVGTSLDVHPIVTLAGLYLGAKFMGFVGMIVIPVGLMVIKSFNDAGRIHLYNSPKRN